MNKSFTKKYLTILWTVTLIVVIVGLCIHIGGWIHPFNFFSNVGDVVSNEVSFDENITGLNLDVDMGEITIEPGDKLAVSYTYREKIAPKIEVKNGELVIKQRSDNRVTFNKIKNQCELKVTIPSDTKLKKASVDSSFGEVILSEQVFDKADIKADCGRVEVIDCEGNSIDLVANLGEVVIDKSNIRSVKAEADMGNVDIEGDFDSIDAKVDMGDLNIVTDKPTDDVDIDADVDLGSVSVNGNRWK